MKYIGVRSCKCDPIDDYKYLGSSKYTPNNKILVKQILKTHTSRNKAIQHEIELHSKLHIHTNINYYNRASQKSQGFDVSGIPHTAQHNKRISEALIGRKRSHTECEAISLAKKGKPGRAKSNEERAKLSKSNKGQMPWIKGKKFTDDEKISMYGSRVKYKQTYVWQHKITKEQITATCGEMGRKYGNGAKPSRHFTSIIRGVSKSYHKWELTKRV